MGDKMRVGLLWFDDDPKKEVSLKVQEAAERYLEKFGQRPNLCYVNPSTRPQATEGIHLDSLRVLPNPLILPDHFWVGEGSKDEEDSPASRS